MPITLTLKAMSGTVKKLAGANIYRPFTAGNVWYHSSATAMSVNDTFSISSRDWVVWEVGHYIDVEFSADSTGQDGQGLNVVGGRAFEWEISSVSGTV